MKIHLGNDFDPLMIKKVRWIRENFKPDQYSIRDTGFIYPDYIVEFTEERYSTLFRIQWS